MGTETYHGSCQCGAVAFEADVDLDQVVICNCSRCRRLGAVLAFTPLEGGFRLERGEAAVTEYLFNTGTIHHLFCATCGVQSHSLARTPDGRKMAAVNINCLDGVDARALSPRMYDGASR